LEELTPEEHAVIVQALRSWLRKIAADAFDALRRDPAQGHKLIDHTTAAVERLIQKFQY
jgi:hypothetical protein